MTGTVIDYESIRHISPEYIEKIKAKEAVAQKVLAEAGDVEHVSWRSVDDGDGHQLFRLVVDRPSGQDCLIQISPLDLTLNDEQFEKLVVEGKRPFSAV